MLDMTIPDLPYSLNLPNHTSKIVPGNIIRLGRFQYDNWKVNYGWYTSGGNREICGWYLTSNSYPGINKPLQKTDLYDIYFVKQ